MGWEEPEIKTIYPILAERSLTMPPCGKGKKGYGKKKGKKKPAKRSSRGAMKY